jgi:mannosylglycerate hydrolase
VHRAMMPRFEEAQALARDIQRDSQHYLARRIDSTRPGGVPEGADPNTHRAMIAFNGLGQPYHGLLNARLDVPIEAGGMGTGGTPRHLRVLDADGEVIPSQVTGQRILESQHPHPADRLVWQVDLEWVGEVPAAGHTVYHIEEVQHGYVRETESDLAFETDRMSNAFLSVVFQPNGTYHVYREDWPFYVSAGLYEDTEDAGDEYNYSPAFTTKTVTSLGASTTISQVAAGPVRAAYEIRQTLRVPKSLASDRMARSKETVEVPIVTTVSLTAGSRRVDVETRVNNTALDHRLRALFETAERPDRVVADTAFGVVRRPIGIPETEGWSEAPVGLNPMQRWFAVEGHADVDLDHVHSDEEEHEVAPHTGVAILQQGLPEYEAMRGDSSTILALTLFRSVGWLSRSGYPAREQGAGPKMPTPEAQMPGEHAFRYAIFPYEGTWAEAGVPNDALAFVAPPAIELADEHEGEIPATQSYVAIEPGDLVLSALKKADDRDALIVRLYNPTGDDLQATVRFHAEPSRVEPVLMDEVTPDKRVSVLRSGDTASFAVPSARIVTLAVTFPGVSGGVLDEWTATPR